MNLKQRHLLSDLHDMLCRLTIEAMNDEQFNLKLGELGIFSKSLDEAHMEVFRMLSREENK